MARSATDGAQMSGCVKFYDAAKGFGFIKVNGLQADVYFQGRDLANAMQQILDKGNNIKGSDIDFNLKILHDGKYYGEHVRLSEPLVVPEQPVPEVQPDPLPAAAAAPVNSKPRAKQKPAAAAPKPRAGWGAQPRGEQEGRIAYIKEMGFTEEQAKLALADGLDVNRALDALLSGAFAEVADHSSTLSTTTPGTPPSSPGSHDSPPAKEEESAPRNPADWEYLLGARDTLVPVAEGAGAPATSRMGSVSHAVSEATDSVLPIVQQQHQQYEESKKTVTPLRPLARLLCNWEGDCSSVQFKAHEHEIVRIWPETRTSLGWIHAEGLGKGARMGWLPVAQLKELPSSSQWMRARNSSQSHTDKQLSVQVGDIVLVDSDTLRDESVFAESCTGAQSGMIHMKDVESLPETYQWLCIARNQSRDHAAQIAVSSGTYAFVDIASRTPEGWVYAWAIHGDGQETANRGWLAASCLSWPEN